MNYLELVEQLPEDAKGFILDNKFRLEFERACLAFGLTEESMHILAGPVGLFYVKQFDLRELPSFISSKLKIENKYAYGLAYELSRRLFLPFKDFFRQVEELMDSWKSMKSDPVISSSKVEEELLKLEPWLSENEEVVENIGKKNEVRTQKENLNIEEAVQKYSQLSEQLLSNAFIRLRKFSEPVRPSIKNWISDYHEQMGPGKHGTFDRGNYLFHSENTKALSSVERQKVSTILKSLDENTLLTIDPEKQEVVFEADSDSNLRIDTRIDKGFEQKSTNSGQGIVNYEQKRTENLQRSADNRQQPSVAVDGMRIVREAEKTLPAAGVAKPVQTQYQKPENVQPFKSQLVQGFGRTTAASMDTRRKVINPSESFGNYAIPEGDLVRKKPDVVKKEDNFPLRASYEAPRSPQVVEKKISTAPQNFGNDISGFQKQQPQPAKKIFSESSQGGQQQGKVSFSSPQQLPVEKKQDSAKRTPFRIVPHGDL